MNLKNLRKEKNLTQKDLAQKLGLSQASISDWEVSKVEPSIDMLIKLADFFETSIDVLVGRKYEKIEKVEKVKENKIMATIIIQGTQEENLKTVNVLKKNFSVFNKKAGYKTDDVQTSIVEIYSEDFQIKEYTAQETLKALECCSNAIQDCSSCPYRKVNECKERLKMDGALMVNRLFNTKTE